ncbi:translation initiation factor IF-2 [PVC group bacterium]|nr:translation initiation factor IF-2 [PVC group bacterium]
MMGIRVYTLAKDLSLSSKELIQKLQEMEFPVKGHMSMLEDDVADLVKAELESKVEPEPAVTLKEEIVSKEKSETSEEGKDKEGKDETGTSENVGQEITIKSPVVVRTLAEALGIKVNDLIRELMKLKIFAAINQALPEEIAAKVAKVFGFELKIEETAPEKDEVLFEDKEHDDPKKLKPRSPVVTLMGHVDHGKTSLLDQIRKTNVADQEHGGITQHIGAYEVFLEKGRVVFLDTPGHKAFTAMRARGANATDVIVLVVAADDSVMPQTKEAVDHARAARVPIVVAINKIDKAGANVDVVKKDLVDLELTPDDWGGKTVCVPVSAVTGEGIEELLELLLLETDLLELKANPDKPARGIVIEAHLSQGRGAVATVLVQDGTLRTGDMVVCGMTWGRVRALINDRGKHVKIAGPATPMEIAGLANVPMAGDRFTVVKNEKTARDFCQRLQHESKQKAHLKGANQVTLENLYDHITQGKMKELTIIVKADVQGSLGVIVECIQKLETEEIKVNVIHDGIGGINESDIMLASASKAIVIGFHVRPLTGVDALAQKEKVQIRCYKIIYELVEDLERAVQGMLDPKYEEQVIGRCVIKQVFKVSRIGTIAGCLVQKGKISRNAKIRLIRDDVEIYSGTLSSLKRFKDDVREVQQNFECGLSVENYNDLREEDIIEAFVMEVVKLEPKS